MSLLALTSPVASATFALSLADSAPSPADLRVDDRRASVTFYYDPADNVSAEVQTVLLVTNYGGTDAVASHMFIRVCDVTKDAPGPVPCSIYKEELVVDVPPVPAQESVTVRVTVEPPAPGRYSVQAVADVYDVVAESDESNNAGSFDAYLGKAGVDAP